MVMMRGYRIGQGGRVDRLLLDTERWPDGWYDSPDKIPGYEPPAPVEPEPYRAPLETGEVYGERRRGGWPKGKPRK